jgi:predicted membrane channel-forming protein YqfA (hemolysin III family)
MDIRYPAKIDKPQRSLLTFQLDASCQTLNVNVRVIAESFNAGLDLLIDLLIICPSEEQQCFATMNFTFAILSIASCSTVGKTFPTSALSGRNLFRCVTHISVTYLVR